VFAYFAVGSPRRFVGINFSDLLQKKIKQPKKNEHDSASRLNEVKMRGKKDMTKSRHSIKKHVLIQVEFVGARVEGAFLNFLGNHFAYCLSLQPLRKYRVSRVTTNRVTCTCIE